MDRARRKTSSVGSEQINRARQSRVGPQARKRTCQLPGRRRSARHPAIGPQSSYAPCVYIVKRVARADVYLRSSFRIKRIEPAARCAHSRPGRSFAPSIELSTAYCAHRAIDRKGEIGIAVRQRDRLGPRRDRDRSAESSGLEPST